MGEGSEYHGTSGPLPVSKTTRGNPNEMTLRFVKAAASLGAPHARHSRRRMGRGGGATPPSVSVADTDASKVDFSLSLTPSRVSTLGMPDIKDYNGKSQYGAAVAQAWH